MRDRFDREPMCEICGEKPAAVFAYLRTGIQKEEWRWKFCCLTCEEEKDEYTVLIDKFLHSPASTVDWLAHLSEKEWINWNDFMQMTHRFRAATGSYGKP